jgi:hypothetical protein
MTLTAMPSEGVEDELTPFSITVTLTDEAGDEFGTTTPVVIKSVTIADAGVTTSFTTNTFTVEGAFMEVFERTLDYRDPENIVASTDAFVKIPKGFCTLFSYVAPADDIRTINAVVELENHSDFVFVFTVRNNWQAANNMLKDYVSQGKF